jgi:hypothetical protein
MSWLLLFFVLRTVICFFYPGVVGVVGLSERSPAMRVWYSLGASLRSFWECGEERRTYATDEISVGVSKQRERKEENKIILLQPYNVMNIMELYE